MQLGRRQFLKSTWVTSCSFFIAPSLIGWFAGRQEPIRFGLITDLHKDIIHDADLRLRTFMEEMGKMQPQALIQMGDFAIPKKENQTFIDAFNRSEVPALHVLGNHDMDEGYSKEQAMASYGMSSAYYSRSIQGIRLVVLDGNEEGVPSSSQGYPSYIGNLQQEWLKEELEKATVPVVVLSHQPIAGIYTIDNAAEIQAILSSYSSKILLAINGHAHVDQFLELGGIRYLHLNSASYYWVGEKLSHLSLDAAVHEQFPSLERTCPYADPLFALLTIDPQQGKVTIKGRRSSWIGPSPAQLGYTILSPAEQEKYLQPRISEREV